MKMAKTCCCALAVTLCVAALAEGVTPNGNNAGRTWIDIGGKDVEGRGWSDTELPFDTCHFRLDQVTIKSKIYKRGFLV